MLWNGNECEKTEVMRISRKLPPEQIRIHKKQEYTEYFSYSGSVVINYASYRFEIKSRIVMEKDALNK
jgi:hypothetical protein